MFDLVAEIGLSAGAAAKVRYTGYLGRVAEDAAPSETREQLGLPSGPLVLATAGGGADGASVLGVMLEALGRWPERARFHCLLVGGPLMSADDRRRLRAMLPGGGPVRFIDHVDDLDPYVAAADVVVSRGGYNTVSEILSFGRPAVIVPREMINGVVDAEQLLRAGMLERRRLAHVIRERDLTASRLLEAVNALLEAPPRPASRSGSRACPSSPRRSRPSSPGEGLRTTPTGVIVTPGARLIAASTFTSLIGRDPLHGRNRQAGGVVGVRQGVRNPRVPGSEPTGAVIIEQVIANVCGSDMHYWKGEQDRRSGAARCR